MRRALQVFLYLLLMVLAGGVGGGVGAFVYRQYFAPSQRQERKSPSEQLEAVPSFGAVGSGDEGPLIAALGRLEPEGSVIDISGGMMGARLASLKVKAGDHVKEGERLGHLDGYDEAIAQKNAAETQLAEAQTRLAAELAYNDALIRQAEVGVSEASDLEPLDIKAQQARVDLLESALETDQKDKKRFESVAKGAIPGQKLDQQDLAVQRDQHELNAAKTLLAKAQAGASLKLQAAQAQLAAARAGKKRVEASAQIESLKRNLELANAHLERTILRAPRDGYILKVLTHPGESTDRLPILKLGDTDVMYAVAEVYETDILGVKVGQTATVTSDALKHEYRGTVERIGRMVFKRDLLHIDPAASADARVVEVWIRLKSPDDQIRGMTDLQVDVKIKVANPPEQMSAAEPSQHGERKGSR